MKTLLRTTYRALGAHWRLKIALSVALTAFFCIPYFTLQHVVFFSVRRLPVSGIDQAVAFVPQWVWVYQSAYVLLSVVPWLADSASDLRRYARGFVLQAIIGFAFFLLMPIEGPRPSVVPTGGMFSLLVSYDMPLNSFPSLHVGLSVYTVLFAARISRGRVAGTPRAALLTLLTVWIAAIAFATLATKQHYALDLPAGAMLAWMCHAWVWRSDSRSLTSDRSAHDEAFRSGWRGESLAPFTGYCGGAAAASRDQPAGGSGS